MDGWRAIGIDPAPKKDAVVCTGGMWTDVAPDALRDFVVGAVAQSRMTLIAWDAPLSYDRVNHSDRRVDRAARAWAKRQVELGRFEPKAINALPFAGVPHWAVTCHALGMPFGDPPGGLRLAADTTLEGPVAIEVHPAVALGAWWIEAGCSDPMPRYKQDPTACARIVSVLGLPAAAAVSDDALDAYVAWRLGELFLAGAACWVGNPAVGGYVMPRCAATDELLEIYRDLP